MRLEHIGDLEAFVQIIERGSLAAAARALGVSKNIITRRLARLEKQLQKRLILRTTRQISLTEGGRVFFQKCVKILQDIRDLEETVSEPGPTLRGTLRVSIPTRMLFEKTLQLVSDLLRKNLELELQLIASDQPIDLVAERIDIAITVGKVQGNLLLTRRLTRFSSWGLAAAPSYLERAGRPTKLADLYDHNVLQFLSTHPEDKWTLLDEENREHEVRLHGNFSCNDSRLLDSAMRAGLGIGIAPMAQLRTAIANGILEAVLPSYRVAPFLVSVVHQNQPARARAIQEFLSLFQSAIDEIS